MKWIGIDYGSKLAGTTAIAFLKEDLQIGFEISEKKRDADQFILDWITKNEVDHIFLDAPLSLPGVYQNLNGYEDYFYRNSDKELKSMSPMFLGGLTARAMRLQNALERKKLKVFEVYPGYLAKILELRKFEYKKSTQNISDNLVALFKFMDSEFMLARNPENWHEFDALLAFFIGWRFTQGQHLSFGNSEEGIIIV